MAQLLPGAPISATTSKSGLPLAVSTLTTPGDVPVPAAGGVATSGGGRSLQTLQVAVAALAVLLQAALLFVAAAAVAALVRLADSGGGHWETQRQWCRQVPAIQ